AGSVPHDAKSRNSPVPSDFFRRLIGGRKPVRPDVADAIAELDALAKARPALQAPALLLRDLLPELLAEPPAMPSVKITRDAACARLAGGLPLLRGEPLPLDRTDLCRRLVLVCKVVERHHAGEAAAALVNAVRARTLDP